MNQGFAWVRSEPASWSGTQLQLAACGASPLLLDMTKHFSPTCSRVQGNVQGTRRVACTHAGTGPATGAPSFRPSP